MPQTSTRSHHGWYVVIYHAVLYGVIITVWLYPGPDSDMATMSFPHFNARRTKQSIISYGY